MTNHAAPDAQSEAPCLVLMFKAPARSKQRLANRIGPLAARLAEQLCNCALEDLDAWEGPICVAPAAPEDADWLRARRRSDCRAVLQCEGNLGERLNHVNRALWEAGHRRQVFIGIDCPALDADYLRDARDALVSHDIVLGPARDGGVVLMGARLRWPALEALDWSGPRLGDQLTALCRLRGWRIATLAPRDDIDTLDDLLRLERELVSDTRAARRRLCDWLSAHGSALRSAAQ